MLDNKKLQNIIKLSMLKGRLEELKETRGYLESSVYYNNRRISLVNQIEKLVAEILGLKRTTTRKTAARPIIIINGEEEFAPRSVQVSVDKELVTEKTVKPELQLLADLFGLSVPEKDKDLEQYLVTTIEGFLR